MSRPGVTGLKRSASELVIMLFGVLKGVFSKVSVPSTCPYGGCSSRLSLGYAYCFSHSAEGRLVDAVGDFLAGTDTKVWEFHRKFTIEVKPLSEGILGLATSRCEMALSTRVPAEDVWRVVRHEAAHILDWTGGSRGRHGGTWVRKMNRLGYEPLYYSERFRLEPHPIWPQCVIRVSQRRNGSWKVRVGALPKGESIGQERIKQERMERERIEQERIEQERIEAFRANYRRNLPSSDSRSGSQRSGVSCPDRSVYIHENGQERCNACDKEVFADWKAAQSAALRQLNQGRLLRAYSEKKCGYWHLTSQPPKM